MTMAITGRWPRAMFYDSKTTLFNWAGSWRGAAAQLLKKHDAKVPEQEFVETWVRDFEGTAPTRRVLPLHASDRHRARGARERLPMHGIRGDPDDIEAFLDLQAKVELFADTEAALTNQQKLGVKVFIYSDVETKYLDMYVAKFKKFKADFVGSTEQAGIAKPNPRTYQWVLRKTGIEARDVLYCAAPMFDIQGAMSAGMIAAWLRRPEGRLSKETHTAGDLAADFEVESLHDVTRLLELNRGTH